MPSLPKLPASGRLPFAPEGLSLAGGDSYLLTGGGDAGYSLESYTRNLYKLRWLVELEATRINSSGVPLKQIASKSVDLSRARSYYEHPLSLTVHLPSRTAYYRLDLFFRDLRGRALGHYAQYVRVLPRRMRARLSIGATSVSPGDVIGFRVENIGTASLTYGARFSIERRTGSVWTQAPGLPKWWPAYAAFLSPGAVGICHDFLLPEDWEAGSYRLSKDVLFKDKRVTIRTFFQVR